MVILFFMDFFYDCLFAHSKASQDRLIQKPKFQIKRIKLGISHIEDLLFVCFCVTQVDSFKAFSIGMERVVYYVTSQKLFSENMSL